MPLSCTIFTENHSFLETTTSYLGLPVGQMQTRKHLDKALHSYSQLPGEEKVHILQTLLTFSTYKKMNKR